MAAMPDIRRSRLRMPFVRRRSTRERFVDAMLEGASQGAQAIVNTVRDARAAVGDRSLPTVSPPAIALPNISPAFSAETSRTHVPWPVAAAIRLPVAPRLSDMRPNARLDVRLPDVDLSGLGSRVGIRASRKPSGGSTSPGAVLAAVVVGMLAGMWLATWPVTAAYIRSFFDAVRERLGLADGWSADSARKALRRIDERTAEWREGPLSRRRRRARSGHETAAGVAVGPGHPDVLRDEDGGMVQRTDASRSLPWTAADVPPTDSVRAQGEASLRAPEEGRVNDVPAGPTIVDAESVSETPRMERDSSS